VAEVLVPLEPPARERLSDGAGEGRRPEGLPAARHHHRAAHLPEPLEGIVDGGAPEHLGFVLRAARDVHRAVFAGDEAMAHVGMEGVGAGHVERGLGGEVGHGVRVGGKGAPSAQGRLRHRVLPGGVGEGARGRCDGLEDPETGEGARTGLLREQ
jgi:hypothetical protein